jgi:AhpD family alkylhydroperoxidase
MDARIPYAAVAPAAYQLLIQLERHLAECPLGTTLVNLVKLRASQINGCAFCIDMHWKDLRAAGESEQRLYGLDAWEESPYYSERERAALAWTGSVTRLGDGHVSDDVFARVRPHFDDKELADLTLAIGLINLWNRLSISFRTPAGSYHPPAHTRKAA